jgi:4-carboxymuconolactone decarboxylase
MSAPAEAPRLAALEPPYEPELAEQLRKWMPPGSEIEPLALFRTLHLNAELASRMRPLGAGILGASACVPPLLREVMIDRTCALTGAEYEWGVHAAAFAAAVGLDQAQLRSTVEGSHADECWGAAEATVMRLAEELHRTGAISDALWHELAELLDPPQIIELIVTAGWYHAIAYLCNGLGVRLEDWAMRFPAATQGEDA